MLALSPFFLCATNGKFGMLTIYQNGLGSITNPKPFQKHSDIDMDLLYKYK